MMFVDICREWTSEGSEVSRHEIDFEDLRSHGLNVGILLRDEKRGCGF